MQCSKRGTIGAKLFPPFNEPCKKSARARLSIREGLGPKLVRSALALLDDVDRRGVGVATVRFEVADSGGHCGSLLNARRLFTTPHEDLHAVVEHHDGGGIEHVFFQIVTTYLCDDELAGFIDVHAVEHALAKISLHLCANGVGRRDVALAAQSLPEISVHLVDHFGISVSLALPILRLRVASALQERRATVTKPDVQLLARVQEEGVPVIQGSTRNGLLLHDDLLFRVAAELVQLRDEDVRLYCVEARLHTTSEVLDIWEILVELI